MLSVADRTDHSFTVKWQAVPDAAAYVYAVDDGAEQSTATLQIESTGLTPETTYRVKVKATAEGFTDSDWTTLSVTTLQQGQLSDPVPEVESKTATSFVVTWPEVTGASSYIYTIDEQPEQSTSTRRIECTELTPETTYQVRIKAVGEGMRDSEWATLSVTTDPGSREPQYTLTVPQDECTGFSARIYVAPKDKEATYYTGIIPKDVWDGYASPQELIDELILSIGDSYPTYLYLYLYYGDYDYKEITQPATEYVAYAFGWDEDGTLHDDFESVVFTTPEGVQTAAMGDVTFSNVTDYGMDLNVTVEDAVSKYHMLISTSDAIDSFIAANGEEKLLTLVLQEGSMASYGGEFLLSGLVPATEYSVLLLTFDEKDHYSLVRRTQSTLSEWVPEQADSPLFTELLGVWKGRQQVYDMDYEYETSTEFDVTIVATVDGATRDYRRYNELVALFDGYTGIDYQSIQSLIASGAPEAAAKMLFGPKLQLRIAADNTVRVDGRRRMLFYGWSQAGNTYMTSMHGTNWKLNTTEDLIVDVSEDKNTLTIRSPFEGYFPTLISGIGDLVVPGLSEIVLTRVQETPAARHRSAASTADRARPARLTLPVWRPDNMQSSPYRRTSPDERVRMWNRMGR